MAPQAPKPRYTIIEEDWITPKETGALLKMGVSSVCKLLKKIDPVTGKPYLESYSPLGYNILVKTSSVLAFLEATRTEPEFWERRRLLSQAANAKSVAVAKRTK